jgi:hypothetical protein
MPKLLLTAHLLINKKKLKMHISGMLLKQQMPLKDLLMLMILQLRKKGLRKTSLQKRVNLQRKARLQKKQEPQRKPISNAPSFSRKTRTMILKKALLT